MPHRRTILKIIHWSMVPMFAWFVLVQPADVARIGPAAVRFHSVMGLIFVSTALLWTGLYLRRGLLSRPGPKLQGWASWATLVTGYQRSTKRLVRRGRYDVSMRKR